jgi:hypothetical protein
MGKKNDIYKHLASLTFMKNQNTKFLWKISTERAKPRKTRTMKNNFHFGTCCSVCCKAFSALLYFSFFKAREMKMGNGGRRDDVKIPFHS